MCLYSSCAECGAIYGGFQVYQAVYYLSGTKVTLKNQPLGKCISYCSFRPKCVGFTYFNKYCNIKESFFGSTSIISVAQTWKKCTAPPPSV